MLQEYIPGEDIGCSLLSAAGELKAFTVPKKVNGEELGVATAIKFIKDEAIADYVRGTGDRLQRLGQPRFPAGPPRRAGKAD